VLIIVALVVRHRRHGDVERSLWLLLSTFPALIFFHPYRLGGIRSPGACWFIVPPFVAVLSSLRRATFGWCAASAAALAVLSGLERGGHGFQLMPGANSPVLYLVSLPLVALLPGFLSLMGQSRERAVGYLERTNQDLCVTRDEALAAARTKAQFLANMRHEIRTPINGVLGMAELLGRSRLDTGQRRYLQTLHRSGEHLLRLIDDILDFSTLEAGGITLEPAEFSPRDLVGHLVETMKIEASTRAPTLSMTVADDVSRMERGDAARVRQILFNLVPTLSSSRRPAASRWRSRASRKPAPAWRSSSRSVTPASESTGLTWRGCTRLLRRPMVLTLARSAGLASASRSVRSSRA
jgi:signal transduction histidine kinase